MREFITEWGRAWWQHVIHGKDFPHISPVTLKRNRAAFRAAVHCYPAHNFPHPGIGREITPQQAQANLDWFLASLPERLATIDRFLAEFGLPAIPSGSTLEEVDHWIARLIHWTNDFWPDKPFRPEHDTDDDVWLYAKREGDEAIFSIALDLGTRFGEVAKSMEPRWHWGLNMERSDLDMPTARRVVMTTSPLVSKRQRPYENWEITVLARYLYPNTISYQIPPSLHAWTNHLRQACTGFVIDL